MNMTLIIVATSIIHLFVLTKYPSECFPTQSWRSTLPSSLSLSSTRRHNHGNGHPSLLDAIANTDTTAVEDARRVFHGRGGLFPGADHLTLDYYPPVFLLTSFQHHLSEEEKVEYKNALESAHPSTHQQLSLLYQYRGQKGNTTTEVIAGEVPTPHIVSENGNRYTVHLERGQNHGLFLDMAAGREWLQNKCADGDVSSVLNLFAYTCAFSVAALNGGAKSVVNVDMSHGALKIGQRNHDLNGIANERAKFLPHNLFKSWGKLKRLGPYDCVVVDPPSYQKGSFVASKDYVKVIRRLPSLLSPDGWALLCLNAPELDSSFLLDNVKENAPELDFVERLDNPPAFESALPERALKVFIFRYKQ